MIDTGLQELALETQVDSSLVGLLSAVLAGAAVVVALVLAKLLSVRRAYRTAWRNCFRPGGDWSWRRGRRELADLVNLYFGGLLLVAGAGVLAGLLMVGAIVLYRADGWRSAGGYLSNEASGDVASPPGVLLCALCLLVGFAATVQLQVNAMTHYRKRLRSRRRQYRAVDDRRRRDAYLAESDSLEDEATSSPPSGFAG